MLRRRALTLLLTAVCMLPAQHGPAQGWEDITPPVYAWLAELRAAPVAAVQWAEGALGRSASEWTIDDAWAIVGPLGELYLAQPGAFRRGSPTQALQERVRR